MKKLLYSLLTLAAALTVTSCLKEVEGGSAAYDDGTLVDATFSVTLGPQTKAFADGTTVNQLYAGIYEITSTDIYAHVTHTESPAAISGKTGEVSFTGKIKRGHSYKIVFWAQKEGAPYTLAWDDAAPTVTATATGNANDESRDAFYGEYLTDVVSGNIDLTGSPITLTRPFAQVNVLVPTANFDDAAAEVTSSMTVAQAPTVLNLATKATSDPADWTFYTATIGEDAFGNYASTHKYVAMNYVLVPQDAAGAGYDVTFSVTSAASTAQVASNKQVKNTPLKPNGRTNIVGNIFAEDFDITVPVVIGPTPGTDQVVTEVTVAVGQDLANAVALTPSATTSIEVGVNHAIEVEADKPAITVEPASFGTAEWNLTTGKLDVTPSVANGNAVITLVFPAVTKAEYSAATVQIYVKVGNGQNEELEQVAAPTFSPAAGAVAVGTEVTLTTTTAGATIQYKLGDGEYQNYSDAIAITDAVTITAKATKEGMTDSDEVVAEYTIAAAPQPTKLGTPVLDEENAEAEESSITLVWDDIENATSYAVTYKVKDAAGEAAVVSPAPTTGGVSIENLDAETTYTITVQALADGFEASDVASIDLTTLATTPVVTSNIANVREQITSTNQNSPSEFSANLAGAVVTYVNGKYNYLEDASGAIVLYMENADLTAGQTISGVISGTGYIYNGTPQITSIGTEYTAAEGGTIPETTVTIADLLANYDTYLSRRIKLVGVTVTGGISGSDRDGTIEQSGASIAVRSQISNGPTLTENEIGDLITFPALYSTNKQVYLYETSQFTKTGVVPVLSAPTSATVDAGVTSYTWNITSNTAWTIATGEGVTATPASGNGDKEVTLTFAENTTDQSREFTATVSATGCEPVTITITQNGTGTVALPAGTILWSETFANIGGTTTTFADLPSWTDTDYDYSGRSGYSANASSVTLTVGDNVKAASSSATNCTAGYLWFNKSVEGVVTTSSINLYGATSLEFTHAQATSGSSIKTEYSTDDGETWITLGTTSGPAEEVKYDFSVSSGVSSIILRFTHPSSNTKNTRFDTPILKVGE